MSKEFIDDSDDPEDTGVRETMLLIMHARIYNVQHVEFIMYITWVGMCLQASTI